MTKYILLAAFVAFLLYWSAKGIGRRLRGEMPGRKPAKRQPDRTQPHPTRRPPPVPSTPPPIRDARFRDVTRK